MNIIQGADKSNLQITVKKTYGSEFKFSDWSASGYNFILELKLSSSDTVLQRFSLNAISGYSAILAIEYVNGEPQESITKETNLALIKIIGTNTDNVTGQTKWVVKTISPDTDFSDNTADDIFCIEEIYIKKC